MIDLAASPAALEAAIVDAMLNGDELAVSALVLELDRVDRPAAVRMVSSDRFMTWWFRNYRQRWIA